MIPSNILVSMSNANVEYTRTQFVSLLLKLLCSIVKLRAAATAGSAASPADSAMDTGEMNQPPCTDEQVTLTICPLTRLFLDTESPYY